AQRAALRRFPGAAGLRRALPAAAALCVRRARPGRRAPRRRGPACGRGDRHHAARRRCAGGLPPRHAALRRGGLHADARFGMLAPSRASPGTPMTRQRHFSMLRDFHLADWFTLANAFCGTGAIFAAMRYLQEGGLRDLMLGMALIPLAFVFDALDGRVARWRKVASTLGRELDSLADVISFGVAPAALGYACGLQGGWDWLVLSFFVGCGVSRLARYNVTAETLAD